MLPTSGGGTSKKATPKKAARKSSPTLLDGIGGWFADTVKASKAGDRRAVAPERKNSGRVGNALGARPGPRANTAYNYTSAGGETKVGHPNKPVRNGTNGGSTSYNGFGATSAETLSRASKAKAKPKPVGTSQAPLKNGVTNSALPYSLTGKGTNTPKPTVRPVVKKTTPSGGGAGTTPDYNPLAGISAPDVSKILAAAAAAANTGNGGKSGAPNLDSYVQNVLKEMGPGTNYGAVTKQLKTDTGTADKKVAAMYSALTLGIRNNDPVLKGIYDDAAKQTQAAGAQAQSTVKNAYQDASNSVAQRLASTGSQGDAVSAAWAAQDGANAQASAAQNQQTALNTNSGHETAARLKNVSDANGAGFQGAETRSGMQQNLADNLAKLTVQQSTENANRRASALQTAIGLQSSDQSRQAAAYSMAIDQANTQFSQQMAMANLGLTGLKTNATIKQGQEKQDTAKLAAQGKIDAAAANATNAANRNKLGAAQLGAQTAGQSKSRKAAAAKTAYDKGQMSKDQYLKFINKLG